MIKLNIFNKYFFTILLLILSLTCTACEFNNTKQKPKPSKFITCTSTEFEITMSEEFIVNEFTIFFQNLSNNDKTTFIIDCENEKQNNYNLTHKFNTLNNNFHKMESDIGYIWFEIQIALTTKRNIQRFISLSKYCYTKS